MTIAGLLLVVPGGALGAVDRAVVVGVDQVEAGTEHAVALVSRHRRLAVVIGLLAGQPVAVGVAETALAQAARRSGAGAADKIDPPVAILAKS